MQKFRRLAHVLICPPSQWEVPVRRGGPGIPNILVSKDQYPSIPMSKDQYPNTSIPFSKDQDPREKKPISEFLHDQYPKFIMDIPISQFQRGNIPISNKKWPISQYPRLG